ncbi:uncharacterized protein LOC126965590 [Leptidea sinapis]|uniref:uncharacterized protein LOC126965589 n=1 Tax=Leptidea sinapis TaxID=189913 RepID=UPI0021C3BA4E|nr:uncharacterized protein LOC126965589 [Leptidea sinapis]XP_050665182.1 uncharacterized protein LOC126965590 [Leptidea sinapis]
MAKVLERFIHYYTSAVSIEDGQFGFQPQVSTDMAIFALKQVFGYYKQGNTAVYAWFLDISRAFDTLNHDQLWKKLRDTSVPSEIVGLLEYWYRNQTNSVRWGSELSDCYQLPCGVRQGGYLS